MTSLSPQLPSHALPHTIHPHTLSVTLTYLTYPTIPHIPLPHPVIPQQPLPRSPSLPATQSTTNVIIPSLTAGAAFYAPRASQLFSLCHANHHSVSLSVCLALRLCMYGYVYACMNVRTCVSSSVSIQYTGGSFFHPSVYTISGFCFQASLHPGTRSFLPSFPFCTAVNRTDYLAPATSLVSVPLPFYTHCYLSRVDTTH